MNHTFRARARGPATPQPAQPPAPPCTNPSPYDDWPSMPFHRFSDFAMGLVGGQSSGAVKNGEISFAKCCRFSAVAPMVSHVLKTLVSDGVPNDPSVTLTKNYLTLCVLPLKMFAFEFLLQNLCFGISVSTLMF